MTVLTLTREHRDALHTELAREVERRIDMSPTVEVLRRPEVQRLFAVFNQVGWEDVGQADGYDVEVDAAWLAEFLTELRRDELEAIAYQRGCLAKARAGDAGYVVCGGDLADTVRETARSVDLMLDTVARCDLILQALPAEVAR